MTTIEAVHTRLGIGIPTHLVAQATIPILHPDDKRPGWAQGDVYALPHHAGPTGPGTPITGQGVKVVAGEADRNSHILSSLDPGCRWHVGRYRTDFDYGLLIVPSGAEAFLTHTGEHGTVAFGAGSWRLWGQVSHEAELRRAID